MKTKAKYGFIIVPIVFFLFAFLFRNTDKKMKDDFYFSSIKGCLKSVNSNKGASIVVNNVTYQIYPLEQYLVNGRKQLFIDIAKRGDSISKDSSSFAFILYKNGIRYHFTGY